MAAKLNIVDPGKSDAVLMTSSVFESSGCHEGGEKRAHGEGGTHRREKPDEKSERASRKKGTKVSVGW